MRCASDSPHAQLAYKLIRKGIISQISMECDYEEGECSICGKRVVSKSDYCVHLRKNKGGELQGQPVYEILHGVTFHDIRRTVKTNMLAAGADKAHRDMILGHSLQGMDVHYLSPTEASLKEAMDRFTRWLDERLEEASANVDQSVDQKAKLKNR